jgi:hypothetical protein
MILSIARLPLTIIGFSSREYVFSSSSCPHSHGQRTRYGDARRISVAATGARRYSFNTKRSPDPCIDDFSTRKKVNKACASNDNCDNNKATRSSGHAAKKGNCCQHMHRKGDLEPPIIELLVEESQKVVTRSRIKNS